MRTVILLGIVSLLTDVSSEMLYPIIPLYLTAQLGATPAIIGLIEGMAESLASLLKVFSGYFSDKVRRRKPLTIAGYGTSAVSKLFLYFSTSWSWVLAARIMDRFGKGIRTAPRDALIAEASKEGGYGRSFGLHRALDTLGAVIGTLLAFWLFTSYAGDYKIVFIYSLIPAFLGVGLLFAVKERYSKTGEKGSSPKLNWRALDSRLRSFLFVIFLFTLGNSSNQFLLLKARQVGMSTPSVLLLYAFFNLIYSIFSYPAGRLSDRIGRKSLLVAGYGFYGLVYLGFAASSRSGSLWALFAIYGLYHALTEGVEKAFVSQIAPPNQKATILGLHATLVGIGLLPASLLAGALWTAVGPSAPFVFGGITGITASVLLALLLPPQRRNQLDPL